jgi:hypothetical protein
MSSTSNWHSEYVYFNWNDASISPKYYSFDIDDYRLIIKDNKYILIPKEEKISNLPDSIPEELFEL